MDAPIERLNAALEAIAEQVAEAKQLVNSAIDAGELLHALNLITELRKTTNDRLWDAHKAIRAIQAQL